MGISIVEKDEPLHMGGKLRTVTLTLTELKWQTYNFLEEHVTKHFQLSKS